SLSKFHRALRDSGAAACAALIGCECRVALNNVDSVHGNIEFFRDHLTHGDPQAGTDVDLACINGDRAIGMDGEEAIYFTPIERFSEFGRLRRAYLRKSGV